MPSCGFPVCDGIAQGCQLATVEDILNEEYPLDYNLPDAQVILRSQSIASSISDAGSSLSGSRKGAVPQCLLSQN